MLLFQKFGYKTHYVLNSFLLADIGSQLLGDYYFPEPEVMNSDDKKVWLPSKHLLNEPEISQSWDVSADSLALWLAQEVDANKLLIVKSSPLPPAPLTAGQASKMQLLDSAFPDHYKRQAILTTLMHATQSMELNTFISDTPHSGLTLS